MVIAVITEEAVLLTLTFPKVKSLEKNCRIKAQTEVATKSHMCHSCFYSFAVIILLNTPY